MICFSPCNRGTSGNFLPSAALPGRAWWTLAEQRMGPSVPGPRLRRGRGQRDVLSVVSNLSADRARVTWGQRGCRLVSAPRHIVWCAADTGVGGGRVLLCWWPRPVTGGPPCSDVCVCELSHWCWAGLCCCSAMLG